MPLLVLEHNPTGQPDLQDQESVKYELDGTNMALGEEDMGSGKLVITTERVLWLAHATDKKSVALDYPFITMHAICRDADAYANPCLYCQLDAVSDEVEDQVSEVVFTPQDEHQLEPLFKAFSLCSSLHPDEDCDPEDEMFDGTSFVAAEEPTDAPPGEDAHQKVLDHLDALLIEPNGATPVEGQFDDAEEEDEHDE